MRDTVPFAIQPDDAIFSYLVNIVCSSGRPKDFRYDLRKGCQGRQGYRAVR